VHSSIRNLHVARPLAAVRRLVWESCPFIGSTSLRLSGKRIFESYRVASLPDIFTTEASLSPRRYGRARGYNRLPFETLAGWAVFPRGWSVRNRTHGPQETKVPRAAPDGADFPGVTHLGEHLSTFESL
jgi:hypothetical protein